MSIFKSGTIVDDRYLLSKHLGEGGMGTVYEAIELELDRHIAIKFLHADMLQDHEQRQRFIREGKLLSEISHAYVVRLYRSGIWNQVPYIAMELLDGLSLRTKIDEDEVDISLSLQIISNVCDAMQYVHSEQIIHRDLKPSNIILLNTTEADLKVVDFGLARLLPTDGRQFTLTQTGALLGTVCYMSPEQCKGQRADSRSDIYSLGCILYELIVGRPPFYADNPVGIMHLHANEPVPRLYTERKQIPNGLETVLDKALAKEPEHRYQSMDSFRADIEMVLAGNGGLIAPITQFPQGRKRAKPLITVIAVVLLTGFILLAAYLSIRHKSGSERELYLSPKNENGIARAIRKDPDLSLRRIRTAIISASQERDHKKLLAKLLQVEQDLEDLSSRLVTVGQIFQFHICRGFFEHEKARVERHRGHYFTELREYQIALKVLEENPTGAAMFEPIAYANLANGYQNIQQFPKAIECYNKALQLFQSNSSRGIEQFGVVVAADVDEQVIICKTQIGHCYAETKLFAKAEKAFREVIEQARSLSGSTLIASRMLLETYDMSGQPTKARSTIIEIENGALEQMNCGQLTKDEGASVYSILSMAASRSWTRQKALELVKKAIELVDGASREVNMNDVDYALKDLHYFAKKDSNAAMTEELDRLDTRVQRLRHQL